MMLAQCSLAVAAVIWQPTLLQRPVSFRRCYSGAVYMQASWANDGEEVDWDKEAAALTQPSNSYYKAIKQIPVPDLIREFAESAPAPVQMAVRATVGQLLGNLPPQIGESSITTTGSNLASLMYSMQMTGYMFRNAEYRRSLLKSIESSENSPSPDALPPVSGKVSIKLADDMVAEVDAAAYMAELRAEVEGLRSQLAAKQEPANGEGALIAFIQSLDRSEAEELTKTISKDVLDAMSALISSLLRDMNVDGEATTQAPALKLREVLILQLVSGYKLRELEVRGELKDRFWDQ